MALDNDGPWFDDDISVNNMRLCVRVGADAEWKVKEFKAMNTGNLCFYPVIFVNGELGSAKVLPMIPEPHTEEA
jgi:hypothetical protein